MINLSKATDLSTLEHVMISGDVSKLDSQNRLVYLMKVCESLSLNPLTRPFEYIILNGKMTLYARKDATDQLRNIRKISTRIVAREVIDDIFLVTVEASDGTGRIDSAVGAVSLVKQRIEYKNGSKVMCNDFIQLFGDERANAMMKAETKAKRRATLSFCGLGFTDESELETIPTRQHIKPDNQEYIQELPVADHNKHQEQLDYFIDKVEEEFNSITSISELSESYNKIILLLQTQSFEKREPRLARVIDLKNKRKLELQENKTGEAA